MPSRAAFNYIQTWAYSLLSDVLEVTPVDTGRLRGNWQITLGGPAEGEVAGSQSRDSQGVLLAEIPKLDRWTLGQSVWITNNTPYAYLYEFGLIDPPESERIRGGYHVRAPLGMLFDNVDNQRSKYPDIR